MKLQTFEFDISDVIHMNLQQISSLDFLHIFVNFVKKKPCTKFYGVSDHFSPTYEVTNFWMIKLCLNVSDVIHTNEHT